MLWLLSLFNLELAKKYFMRLCLMNVYFFVWIYVILICFSLSQLLKN